MLKGFNAFGIPYHKLTLKINVLVMLFRNIYQTKGLFNGTRVQIVRLGRHIIKARIIFPTFLNDITYLPHMKLTLSYKRIIFRFQRRQFPLVFCFPMSINKT